MLVSGIDGAPGGWLVASWDLSSDSIELHFTDSIDGAIDDLLSDRCAVTAIDIPIGLSTNGNRAADGAARARLGTRRSTFFPTPVRAVLGADNFDTANLLSREASGKGLSIQAWNLVPKIAEVDEAWQPPLADHLVEAHPELSFAEMADAPLRAKKSTSEGAEVRRALLAQIFGGRSRVDALVDALPRRLHVDALDAMAITWTAARVHRGQAITLGGEVDDAGRPMALWI